MTVYNYDVWGEKTDGAKCRYCPFSSMMYIEGVATPTLFQDLCAKKYGCGHTYNIWSGIFKWNT